MHVYGKWELCPKCNGKGENIIDISAVAEEFEILKKLPGKDIITEKENC